MGRVSNEYFSLFARVLDPVCLAAIGGAVLSSCRALALSAGRGAHLERAYRTVILHVFSAAAACCQLASESITLMGLLAGSAVDSVCTECYHVVLICIKTTLVARRVEAFPCVCRDCSPLT